MKFSEIFKVKKNKTDDWFDPDLQKDTTLFIGPFLLYNTNIPEFYNVKQDVIKYFQVIFNKIAQSNGKTSSNKYTEAVSLLSLGEFSGICLGYTENGIAGSGFGWTLALSTAKSIWQSINAGLQNINYFYLIPLIQQDIERDRVSDLLAWIIRKRLSGYTQRICNTHNIPQKEFFIPKFSFNYKSQQWEGKKIKLPENPFVKQPILLVPETILGPKLWISKTGFINYCKEFEQKIYQQEFGQDIKKNLNVDEIINFAKNNPNIAENYLSHVEKTTDPIPYNFSIDTKNIDKGYFDTANYVKSHGIQSSIETNEDLETWVKRVIKEYKNYIQSEDGWRRLWNDNRRVSKASIRELLYGLLIHYAFKAKIDFLPKRYVGDKPITFECINGVTRTIFLSVHPMSDFPISSELESKLKTKFANKNVDRIELIILTVSEEELERVSDFRRIFKKAVSGISKTANLTFIDGRNRRINTKQ